MQMSILTYVHVYVCSNEISTEGSAERRQEQGSRFHARARASAAVCRSRAPTAEGPRIHDATIKLQNGAAKGADDARIEGPQS